MHSPRCKDEYIKYNENTDNESLVSCRYLYGGSGLCLPMRASHTSTQYTGGGRLHTETYRATHSLAQLHTKEHAAVERNNPSVLILPRYAHILYLKL